MLGQFPMINDLVREQEREMRKNLRRVEEDIFADNMPEKRQPLARLMKLIKR